VEIFLIKGILSHARKKDLPFLHQGNRAKSQIITCFVRKIATSHFAVTAHIQKGRVDCMPYAGMTAIIKKYLP
jgi:hypothetical protein